MQEIALSLLVIRRDRTMPLEIVAYVVMLWSVIFAIFVWYAAL